MELIAFSTTAIYIFDVTSAVLAAITAYLYFWLPNVQDSHGTCVFHFSLNIAFMQAFFLLYEITFETNGYSFGNFCMTKVVVLIFFVVATHVWSVILSYNTWKQIKQISIVNQMYPTRTLNYYRIFGYSVPSFCALLMLIYILSFLFRGYIIGSCYIDTKLVQMLPSIGSVLPNIFYFADSQRKLWNLFTKIHKVQNENYPSTSSLTALRYKMFLNLKLCLTMNIPFGLGSLILLIVVFGTKSYDSVPIIGITSDFVTSLQGTFIFIAAVAFRKRVIKGFIKYGDKSVLGFIRVPECLKPSANDDVEETDDDTGRRYPEEERGATPLQSVRNEDGTQILLV